MGKPIDANQQIFCVAVRAFQHATLLYKLSLEVISELLAVPAEPLQQDCRKFSREFLKPEVLLQVVMQHPRPCCIDVDLQTSGSLVLPQLGEVSKCCEEVCEMILGEHEVEMLLLSHECSAYDFYEFL